MPAVTKKRGVTERQLAVQKDTFICKNLKVYKTHGVTYLVRIVLKWEEQRNS